MGLSSLSTTTTATITSGMIKIRLLTGKKLPRSGLFGIPLYYCDIMLASAAKKSDISNNTNNNNNNKNNNNNSNSSRAGSKIGKRQGKHIKEDRDDEEEDQITEAGLDLTHLWDTQRTMVEFVTYAMNQDQDLAKEVIKLVKSLTVHLSVFSLRLLLAAMTVQKFEAQVLDVIKKVILIRYVDESKQCDVTWLKQYSLTNASAGEAAIVALVNSKIADDRATGALVKLGFALMESGTAKVYAQACDEVRRLPLSQFRSVQWYRGLPPQVRVCCLGVQIIWTVFAKHETVRESVGIACLDRFTTNPQQCDLHTSLLSHLTRDYAHHFAEGRFSERAKNTLEFVPYMPVSSARLILKSFSPLLRLRSDLRDYVVLLLRKSLYLREAGPRMVAACGFVDLLNTTQHGPNGHSVALVSASQAATNNALTKTLDIQCEILSILKRAMTQQLGVREVLYESLTLVCLNNDAIQPLVADMLMHQLLAVHDEVVSNPIPFRVGECLAAKTLSKQLNNPQDAKGKGSDKTLDLASEIAEPLPELLRNCVACMQANSRSASATKATEAATLVLAGQRQHLTKLMRDAAKRVSKMKIEDLDLKANGSQSTQLDPDTTEGRRRLAQTMLLQGTIEVRRCSLGLMG
eukprot:c10297_g1_i1.p1 GENE.c10297_g1_i1~~c10297_g1_i1.p1  ORF type:complete len:633 (-),score=118.78 c10297_g1_i1:113-2011(-)